MHSVHSNGNMNHTDIPLWGPTTYGIFTTKSVYPFVAANVVRTHNKDFQWLWELKTWNKLKYFLWQCYHDRLPTKVFLNHIGVATPLYCPVCPTIKETSIHIFLMCPTAKQLWEALGVNTHPIHSLSTHWMDGLYKQKPLTIYPSLTWNCLFSFALWLPWLNRNKNTFHNLCNLVDSKWL